ncbi:LysM peptidoglycan-binding domain-containing protein [Fluviibacterium sp. DFM31]|uniref:LysM peptidoglycan-binding domain-containing protein n=1 Tax=Meridianimarinicoccus marinus TaxID=3231483 RepID=A0ABV3L7K4_9RHOB
MVQLTFQRLTLDKQPNGSPIMVPYNPTELALSKSAQYSDVAIPGIDQPIIQFVRGESEALTLELFFDSTEAGTGAGADSVQPQVDQFHRLVTIDGNLHTPPIVRMTWGTDFPGVALGDNAQPSAAMDAIVLSCARRFTLFNADGIPLRATVSLQLREYLTLSEQVDLINFRSADHTRVRTVREGETLPLIAYEAYDDPAKWRLIAEANGLSDVRHLQPGMQLTLPPTV